jgi:hypothetical protein
MDPTYVIPGLCLLSITVLFAMTWRRQAEWVRRWGDIMSEEDGRPWWRRGHFRPNYTQSVIVTWLFIILFAVIAIGLLAAGLND